MSIPSTETMALASEERAEQAEQSPFPVFLQIARVIVWIVWAVVLITAFMLLLAFFLRLGGANPDAGFVEWVERSVERAMSPFRGIFPARELSGDSVLDMSLLFAAIVYFVVALIIDAFLRWLTHRLHRDQRDAARLRVEADRLAQQAAAERHASDLAAQSAAAREYARQQVAAEQYAIAQAAAQEAIAHQTAQEAAQRLRAKPASPQPTPAQPGTAAASTVFPGDDEPPPATPADAI